MELEQEIEQLVLGRKTLLAEKKIIQFLSKQGKSHSSKIKACGWYRRLGLLREGYLLLAPKEWKLFSAAENKEKNTEFLWLARFLNLMGSTPYAAHVLSALRISTAEEHRIAGNIWLVAGNYEKSLEHFTKARDLDLSNQDSYQHRFALLGISDSLVALGRSSEAVTLIHSIKLNESEKLFKGVVLAALGEAYCKEKNFKKALSTLKEAEKCFEEKDVSPDHGTFFKWLGFAYAMTKKEAEAAAAFKKSLKIMKTPNHRAEVWLDVFYQMDVCGLLPAKDKIYISIYPGLSESFLKRHYHFEGISIGSKKASIQIFPNRDEWIMDGKSQWGLSLELNLLQALRRSGNHGVSLSRLKSLLWPDEVTSYLQLEQRIWQLIKRIQKEYKLKIAVESGVAILDPESQTKVSVEVDSKNRPAQFFLDHPSFRSVDFAECYGLGKTRASQIIKELLENGTLIAKKEGVQTYYSINTSLHQLKS